MYNRNGALTRINVNHFQQIATIRLKFSLAKTSAEARH